MFFTISHHTRYDYSVPVFLEPHLLKLCPRTDSGQKLLSFELKIDPQPAGFSDIIDPEGNIARWIWHHDTTPYLDIGMKSEVITHRENPYDYIITTPSFQTYPFHYPEEILLSLYPCLSRDKNLEGEEVKNLTSTLLKTSGGDIFGFLNLLNSFLYENWQVIIREEGEPLPPELTIQQGKGSCRDIALLFMAVCRNAGIASRFVSGYQEGDPDTEKHQLHAWAEVYIPGGGWRGYDPIHGLAVSDRHIALAASCLPQGASPCTGNFRGSGAKAAMTFEIKLTSEFQSPDCG